MKGRSVIAPPAGDAVGSAPSVGSKWSMARQVLAGEAGTVRIGDLVVNRLGLGTNRVTDTEPVRAFLRRALELGVNFFDTADIYQSNASEIAIGQVMRSSRAGVTVATKGGMLRPGLNGRPEYLRRAVDGSRTRLGIDCIPLYQLHRVDPEVPIEQSVGALRDLQGEGKIRHIGLSNVTVEEIERARQVVSIVSVQNQYNVRDRTSDDVVDFCTYHGIAFLPWTPLGRGAFQEDLTLVEVASEYGVTVHQLALRWLLRRSPVVLPIPGTLSVPHLQENLEAARIDLTENDFQRLTA